MLRPLLAAALLTIATGTAAAQSGSPSGGRPPAVQAVTINPILVPFGGFVVEYERATAPGISLGLSGSYYDFIDEEDSYGAAEAKLRFYPGERAPRGFSIGITAGAAWTRDEECCDAFADDGGRTAAGATAGVVLDYNWLIGRSRRFFVGTGVGAKRLFGDLGDGDYLDIEVLPLARLQVGIAF